MFTEAEIELVIQRLRCDAEQDDCYREGRSCEDCIYFGVGNFSIKEVELEAADIIETLLKALQNRRTTNE